MARTRTRAASRGSSFEKALMPLCDPCLADAGGASLDSL